MVESLDSDQNNKITLAEFTSEPNIFESIDTNNDQALTLLEVKAAYKKIFQFRKSQSLLQR